ncbi:MAG: hypothetical protein AMXMBFR33_39190 [Candidatus Xenobia bacterium]
MASKDPFAPVQPVSATRPSPIALESGSPPGSPPGQTDSDRAVLSEEAYGEEDTSPLAGALAANYNVQAITFHPTVEKNQVVEPNQPLGKIETSLGPKPPSPSPSPNSERRSESAAAGTLEDGGALEQGIPRNGNFVSLPNKAAVLEPLSAGPVGGDRSPLMQVFQQGASEPSRLDLLG